MARPHALPETARVTDTPPDPSRIPALFEAGQVDRLRQAVQALTSGAGHSQLFPYLLAAGALGALPRPLLDSWLEVIPEDLRPDLRYRALIGCGCWTRAATLRHHPAHSGDDAFQSACRMSASLALLAAGKPRMGMRFYHHRMAAGSGYHRHVTRVYSYRPAWQTQAGTIFLDQGVGDRFLHLAQIRAHHPPHPLTFAVVPRWQPVIAWLFPEDRVIDMPTAPDNPVTKANASGDYLALAMFKTGRFAPAARLGPPVRRGPPRFGLVWRGGSHQNQTEERQMSLHALLDLLPDGTGLVALQPSLTEEERGVLRAMPGMHLPAFDVTADLKSYARLVSGLAGVIGVDNSAVHVAGVFGVPSYTFMNRAAHWYWGVGKTTDALYPEGRTCSIDAPDRADLHRWIDECRSRYAARSPA
jgi:hypothetical protein